MRQQIEAGLLIVLGLGLGAVGTFSCMGGGWIFVAGLLWGLSKYSSSRMMSFKLGLTLGMLVSIAVIIVMGATGMITH